MSDIWEAKVAENVQRELTNMHPRIAAYLKKLVKEEANNDWGQALALVDMVHKELLEVEAQLQNMGKGAVPPSHSVQNLVARLEALEQDHELRYTLSHKAIQVAQNNGITIGQVRHKWTEKRDESFTCW